MIVTVKTKGSIEYGGLYVCKAFEDFHNCPIIEKPSSHDDFFRYPLYIPVDYDERGGIGRLEEEGTYVAAEYVFLSR